MKKWWIFKGTSNFCGELAMSDDFKMERQRPDGFYDVVSNSDTIDGGICVVEKKDYDALAEVAKEMADAAITLARETKGLNTNIECVQCKIVDLGIVLQKYNKLVGGENG